MEPDSQRSRHKLSSLLTRNRKRVRELSEEVRTAIVEAVKSGRNQNDVAKEFDVAPRNVSTLFQTFKQTGSVGKSPRERQEIRRRKKLSNMSSPPPLPRISSLSEAFSERPEGMTPPPMPPPPMPRLQSPGFECRSGSMASPSLYRTRASEGEQTRGYNVPLVYQGPRPSHGTAEFMTAPARVPVGYGEDCMAHAAQAPLGPGAGWMPHPAQVPLGDLPVSPRVEEFMITMRQRSMQLEMRLDEIESSLHKALKGMESLGRRLDV
ncbi:hypothetical protein CDD82_6746 [Ophiocordyceps australis]|uniref:HTH psq-type domain-containing protein n=1 Tax=Ophiocordyceps australis TaxID=1399860 RepID=A0A2C5YVP5_9HYPO|nr:hypothetical protein CDD82_6746 [Ophiocordyceps australis]